MLVRGSLGVSVIALRFLRYSCASSATHADHIGTIIGCDVWQMSTRTQALSLRQTCPSSRVVVQQNTKMVGHPLSHSLSTTTGNQLQIKVPLSPPPQLHHHPPFLNAEPLLTTVTTPTHNNFVFMTSPSPGHLSARDYSQMRISDPVENLPHSSALLSLGGPCQISTSCQACGEFSAAGYT